MTALESLSRIAGNLNAYDRRIVRRYIAVTGEQNNASTQKSLRLFDLVCEKREQERNAAQLEKLVYGRRCTDVFARLVAQLHKRVVEALCLPVATRAKNNMGERTNAQLHFHRQYIKALVLYEACDYDAADVTLVSLVSWANRHELYAESITASEFLMHIARISGNADVIRSFSEIPDQSRRTLLLIANAESIRERMDRGELRQVKHTGGELKGFAKGWTSYRALFVLTGVEGKAAELRGDYKMAEKYFREQLDYCSKAAVGTEENFAQAYADLAGNALCLEKREMAKHYADSAMRCKKKFKTTVAQLEGVNLQLEKRHERPGKN